MNLRKEELGFIFPGQGSQVVGMGKDFYDKYKVSRQVFDMAEDVCGMNIKSLCFEENAEINQTKNMQICIFTTCVAISRALREEGIESGVNAGLSLGEYAALEASNVMELKDLFYIVKSRGIYMQDAYRGESAMAAITSRAVDVIEKVCSEIAGVVNVANYNSPMQTVITGEKNAVEEVLERLADNGVKNAVRLKVSGPFHCELMKSAQESLAVILKEVPVYDFSAPYISNVTAQYVRRPEEVKELLVQQVVSSVKWHQSIRTMIENGTRCFIEIGPGKSLTNLLLSIDRTVEKISVSNVEELQKIL